MSICSIMVPLGGKYDPADPESLDPPALDVALGLASRFDAHVMALSIIDDPKFTEERFSPWIPTYGAAELLNLIHRESKARRARTRAAFEGAIAKANPRPMRVDKVTPGYSTAFVEEIGEIREVIGNYGRLSDLVVLASSKARWESRFRPILEASLRRTGRPVLVVPCNYTDVSTQKIAIAWDGSMEAGRAATAAIDFAKDARSATVICCDEGKQDPPTPEGVIAYLACKGIDAKPLTLKSDPRHSARTVIDAAKANGCDLIVMGSYVHSRAYALMFGSMTEYVLSNPPMPALLVP